MANTDGFFDETLSIQLLPEQLANLINDLGWSTLAKYRVWSPLSGDNYRKKFAQVYLFSSKGNDKQVRNFGFIHGYGGSVTPNGEEPTISHNSFLGELGESDGSTTLTFNFKVHPVIPSSVVAYDIDGNVISDTGYTVNGEAGTITFDTAPAQGMVTATYSLTDNAPEMPRRMWFFTFEDARDERYIYQSEGLSKSQLNDSGDGLTFNFPLQSGERVKTDSVQVYVAGAKEDPANYTVDYTNGSVTFSTTPSGTVESDYILKMTKDVDNDFGDIEVPDFNAHTPKDVAGAVYSGLRFLFPSIPTALSLIPDEEYPNGWDRDSQIYVWGNGTADRIVSYFRIDPAPDPEKAFFAPLYIGRLSTIGKSPRLNSVLMSGGRSTDEIGYIADLKLGHHVVDYGSNTANGNSDVLLQQSVGGSRNQRHYLAFITHDVAMDSSNESKFNPSVYSGKYHISPMYIVHPSDGFVGRLDEVYAVHPKNIAQLDELEVQEQSTDEQIGTGDGTTTEFFLFHTPVMDTDFKIQLVDDSGCTTYTSAEEGTDYNIDYKNKKITFTTAPTSGQEVFVTYNYNQVYRYTLADTPQTPFQLANISPYTPIGLGFLKENL